jgi:hypothetical protein
MKDLRSCFLAVVSTSLLGCGTAAGAQVKDVCSVGLFVNPAQLERAKLRFGSSEYQPERAWLDSRIDGVKSARPAEVYRGKSSWAYLDIARGELIQSNGLALLAVLSPNRIKADEAAALARGLLLKWTREVPEFEAYGPKDRRLRNAEAMRDYAGEGLYLSLTTIGVAQTYHLLRCRGNGLAEADNAVVRRWLTEVAGRIQRSRDAWVGSGYFGGQYANNHLAMHDAAVYAAGVLTGNAAMMRWAIDSPDNPKDFRDLIGEAIYDGTEEASDARDRSPELPARGEIVDRYRMADASKGLHYATFHYAALELIAEAASNQGTDAYRIKGSRGESMADPALYYGRLLSSFPCSHGSKIPSGDKSYRFYGGAPVETYYWTWIDPALDRLQGDSRIKDVSAAVAGTRCRQFAPPYVPLPFNGLTHRP